MNGKHPKCRYIIHSLLVSSGRGIHSCTAKHEYYNIVITHSLVIMKGDFWTKSVSKDLEGVPVHDTNLIYDDMPNTI